MDGEEELEELVRETYAVEEIDMDYEFDAARFYDFSRVETDCEAREAERWLESYGNYPPSPFIIKLKWRKGVPTGVVNTSALSKDVEDVNANDRELNNHVTQDIVSQSKAKSPVKSSLLRSSTLMNPTASHLAKLNQLHLVQSIRSLRLKNKLGNIDDKSSQNSSVTDDLATKRQKLEAGYLSKDAQLKHQALLLHKVPKRVANARLKTTTPREPDLETAHRAERRWYKVNAKSGEEAKPNARAFKAYPLNRKILKSPSLPLTRRSKPHLPEFQVFQLKTSERAMQNKCNNEPSMPCQSSSFQNENTEYKRSNSGKSFRQEKCQTVYSFKACTPYNKLKLSSNGKVPLAQKVKQATTVTSLGLNFSTDRRIQDELPIRLFSKLCITSGTQQNTKTRATNPLPIEATKERTPSSFQEHEMINVAKERSQRLLGGKNFEYWTQSQDSRITTVH